VQTAYVGQAKLIQRNGCFYQITDESREAVVQAEWAEGVLSRPAVVYANGRSSHDVANEVLEAAEDGLIDYLVCVPR
jgi:hypothetical protein